MAEREETPKERIDRELIELLNELRVVLPGVTVLFAFELAVPFAKGWARVTTFQRDVFIVGVLATVLSVGLLTAPSSYHRLRFRDADKERLVIVGNRLAIAGMAAFAIGLEGALLLILDYLLSRAFAIGATAAFGIVVLVLWYGLPLLAELRERRARS